MALRWVTQSVLVFMIALVVSAANDRSLAQNLASQPAKASSPTDATSRVTLAILRDAPAPATIEDVCCGSLRQAFVPLTAPGFSTRQFASPVWIRIDPGGQTGVLRLGAIVDEATLYRVDPAKGAVQVSRAGDTIPFSVRDVKTPQIAFPIGRSEPNSPLYLRVEQPTHIYVPLSIETAAGFDRDIETENWIHVLLIGAISIMIVYNSFLAFVTRELAFLFNALCIAALLLVDVYLTGFGAAYFWPDHAWLSNLVMNGAYCAGVVFGSVFFLYFLRSEHSHFGDQVFKGLAVAALLAFSLSVVLPYQYVQRLMIVIIAATLFWMISYVSWRAWNGDIRARILLVPAVAAVIPGVTLVIFQKIFGIGLPAFDAHLLEGTLVIEALMFSLALAYRIRLAESERLEAGRELRRHQQHATTRLVSAVDDERKRVAADLHDLAGQGLLAITNRLARISRSLTAREKGEIEQVADYSRTVVSDIRRISHHLHPATIEHLGWQRAIEHLLEPLEQSQNMSVDLEMHVENDVLTPTQQLQVYRIVQELASNVAKHSRATACSVQFWREGDKVCMEITDNGVGIPRASGSARNDPALGHGIIEERTKLLGGEWSIDSLPGETIVRLQFPIGSGQIRSSVKGTKDYEDGSDC